MGKFAGIFLSVFLCSSCNLEPSKYKQDCLKYKTQTVFIPVTVMVGKVPVINQIPSQQEVCVSYGEPYSNPAWQRWNAKQSKEPHNE